MSLFKAQSFPRANARVLNIFPISPRVVPAVRCLRQCSPQTRTVSTIPKVKVKNPLVELDGDEVLGNSARNLRLLSTLTQADDEDHLARDQGQSNDSPGLPRSFR